MLQSCRLLNSIVRRKLVCSAALILICFLLYLRFSHPHLGKLRIPLFVGGRLVNYSNKNTLRIIGHFKNEGFDPVFFAGFFWISSPQEVTNHQSSLEKSPIATFEVVN